MCVSCGCGKVHDNHGDDRNLTIEDLQGAAEAGGVSMDQVVSNIGQSARQGTMSGGSMGNGGSMDRDRMGDGGERR